MNVLEILSRRNAHNGYQLIDKSGTVVDVSKGVYILKIDGGGSVYLPPSRTVGTFPFIFSAATEDTYTIYESKEDDPTPDAVATLSASEAQHAFVWWNGFSWNTLASSGTNVLLDTILNRNDSTGILSVAGDTYLTEQYQCIVCGDNAGGGYALRMPQVEKGKALPFFFMFSPTMVGPLTVAIRTRNGEPIGTISYGVHDGAIVIGNGTKYQIFYLQKKNTVDSIVETDNYRIPVTQTVTRIINEACENIMLPELGLSAGRFYGISTEVASDTVVKTHFGEPTGVVLNASDIKQALFWSDGANWHFLV